MNYLYYIFLFIGTQIYSQSNLTFVKYQDLINNTLAGNLVCSKVESLFEKVLKKQSTIPIQYSNGTIVYPPNSIDSLANKKRLTYFNTKSKYFVNNSITNDTEFIIKDFSLAQ